MLLVVVVLAITVGAFGSDLDILRQRSRETFAWPANSALPGTVTTAKSYAKSLNATCYWPDIDYFSVSRADWSTATHMSRTVVLVQALTAPGSTAFEDPALTTAAHCALAVWLSRNFVNSNWWFQWIGIELELQQIFLMLGTNRTSADEQAELIKYSFNSAWWLDDWAGGANLVDMLQIEAMRGIASDNVTAVDQAFGTMWLNVMQGNVTDNWQGIVSDMSYHFHGQQLLNCAYGSVWLASILQWWVVASGTTWAMPDDRTAIVAQYVAEGNAFMTFNGGCDWAAIGRGLDRPGPAFGWGVSLSALGALAQTAGAAPWASALVDFVARIAREPSASPLVGNKHFHTIDYHTHHRKTWGASLKMHGNNSHWTVIGNECDNSENVLGEHTGDGVLNVLNAMCCHRLPPLTFAGNFRFTSTGPDDVGGIFSAYENIFPLLDWNALGGTTVEHDTPVVECSMSTPNYTWVVNNTQFVGGASDGLFGVTMMDTATHHTTTQRSWFFLDDVIVAFATNLTNNGGASEVWTTLSSRLLPTTGAGSTVSVAFHNGTTVGALPDGDFVFPGSDVAWILGGGLGFVPTAAVCGGLQAAAPAVGVRIGTVTGNWSTIGAYSGNVTGRLLTVYLNHGHALPADNASNTGYAYVLVPNTTATTLPVAVAGVACLSPTPTVHVVAQLSGSVLAAVFWAAGGGSAACNSSNWEVDSDTAGAVLVSQDIATAAVTVTLANPTLVGALVHVTVNRALQGVGCASAGTNRTVFALELPTDPNLLGKSVALTCTAL